MYIPRIGVSLVNNTQNTAMPSTQSYWQRPQAPASRAILKPIKPAQLHNCVETLPRLKPEALSAQNCPSWCPSDSLSARPPPPARWPGRFILLDESPRKNFSSTLAAFTFARLSSSPFRAAMSALVALAPGRYDVEGLGSN